jgi:carbon-monoxide dehydrogenase large subunit
VDDVQMPCTPARVWQAINSAGSGAATQAAAMPHFDEGEAGASSTEGAQA